MSRMSRRRCCSLPRTCGSSSARWLCWRRHDWCRASLEIHSLRRKGAGIGGVGSGGTWPTLGRGAVSPLALAGKGPPATPPVRVRPSEALVSGAPGIATAGPLGWVLAGLGWPGRVPAEGARPTALVGASAGIPGSDSEAVGGAGRCGSSVMARGKRRAAWMGVPAAGSPRTSRGRLRLSPGCGGAVRFGNSAMVGLPTVAGPIPSTKSSGKRNGVRWGLAFGPGKSRVAGLLAGVRLTGACAVGSPKPGARGAVGAVGLSSGWGRVTGLAFLAARSLLPGKGRAGPEPWTETGAVGRPARTGRLAGEALGGKSPTSVPTAGERPEGSLGARGGVFDCFDGSAGSFGFTGSFQSSETGSVERCGGGVGLAPSVDFAVGTWSTFGC